MFDTLWAVVESQVYKWWGIDNPLRWILLLSQRTINTSILQVPPRRKTNKNMCHQGILSSEWFGQWWIWQQFTEEDSYSVAGWWDTDRGRMGRAQWIRCHGGIQVLQGSVKVTAQKTQLSYVQLTECTSRPQRWKTARSFHIWPNISDLDAIPPTFSTQNWSHGQPCRSPFGCCSCEACVCLLILCLL